LHLSRCALPGRNRATQNKEYHRFMLVRKGEIMTKAEKLSAQINHGRQARQYKLAYKKAEAERKEQNGAAVGFILCPICQTGHYGSKVKWHSCCDNPDCILYNPLLMLRCKKCNDYVRDCCC
jgi:hypothetical protein